MKARWAMALLIIVFCDKINAQTTHTLEEVNPLSFKIRFCDFDHNDSLSKQEVWSVIKEYLSNPTRNVQSDLVRDVECVIIDLISYNEKINCEALKNTPGSKRFIELYYVDRFAAAP